MGVLHIEWLLHYRRGLFSVLEQDVRYNWWVRAPDMHHSLFRISHLCVLTCIAWKLQVIHGCCAYWTTALLLKTFFVWFRELLERFYWRATASDTIQLFSGAMLCALQACTYITIWCPTTHDNKTHIPYECMLHTKLWLYCQQRIVL